MSDANFTLSMESATTKKIVRRAIAITMGLKTYFTGKSCPKGHISERYTSAGTCIQCAAEISKSKEKKKYDKEYGEINKEKRIARSRAYSAKTSDKRIANATKWAEENPDKRRAISQAYKARRRSQEKSSDSTSDLMKWEKSAKKLCYWCGVACDKTYHVDHYFPLSKGGKHEIKNLVISCKSCNLRKSAKDPYEFAKSKGKLF